MIIFKFPLALTRYQKVSMPPVSQILSVGVQYNQIQVWAIVNSELPDTDNGFTIYGTGRETASLPGEFIGTVHLDEFVWHIFYNGRV